MRSTAGLLLCGALGHVGVRGRQLRDGLPESGQVWPKGYWEDLVVPEALTQGADIPEYTWPAGYWEDPSPEKHNVLLYPRKKLAFCYIPKNSCDNFNLMFNYMNGLAGPGQLERSSLGSFGYSLADVSHERGWKWAVFLRDPLVRYLSAWGSKCFKQEDNGDYCLHGMVSPSGNVSDFEDHVLTSLADPASVHWDGHWEQQQLACGGLRNATGYDFIGHLEGNVSAQVHDMLRMVGASEDYVEEFFPSEQVAGHHMQLDPFQYYKNGTIRKAVRDLYLTDFDLPGMI